MTLPTRHGGSEAVTVAAQAVGDLDRIAVPVRHLPPSALVRNLALLVLGSIFVIPLLWLFLASLDSGASLAVKLPALTLANYQDALGEDRIRSLWMSTVLSSIAAVASTSAAVLAGYALSRRYVPGKATFMLVMLFLTGVPIAILVIPVYQLFSQLNWLSLIPTGVFLGVTSLPFQVWMVKNAMDDVPGELEEAAKIEQAGTLQILARVVIPLTLPGIGAAAIFGFINAWGSFIVPLVLLSSGADQPAPVMIYSFVGLQGIQWGAIAAYGVVYSLPVIVLFVAMSRLFRGVPILGGAIKG